MLKEEVPQSDIVLAFHHPDDRSPFDRFCCCLKTSLPSQL
ncbi:MULTISPECIES: hypothetical protein [unclassified Microcoleus]|nr:MULTISPECIES: hypothetical protein [unclassified Microcoleus]